MSDIRTRPVTPEYEKTWERIFGKRKYVLLRKDLEDMDDIRIASLLISNGFDPNKLIQRNVNFDTQEIIFMQ